MWTWESFQLSYFSPGGFFPVSLCPQKPQTIQYIFLYIETKNWVPVYFQWSLSILFLNLDKLRWSIPLLTRSFTIWLLTLLGCSTSKFFLQYQYVFKQRSDKKKVINLGILPWCEPNPQNMQAQTVRCWPMSCMQWRHYCCVWFCRLY